MRDLLRKIMLSLFLAAVVLSAASRGKRVLFIGDSITDGAWGNSKVWNTPSEERDQHDMNHIYGHGYMMMCASHYQATYPMDSLTFWNRGISGNTLADLHGRWRKDALSLSPDVISILVGTNDVDRCVGEGLVLDMEAWEQSYRKLLDTTVSVLPDVRFVLCTPFVAETGRLKGSLSFGERARIISEQCEVVRRIAKDYDAVLVPFDELIAELLQVSPSETYWVWDGIHPTPAAHYRMAQMWIGKCEGIISGKQSH